MKPSLRVLAISLEYPPCPIGGYGVMCAQVCEWLHRGGHDVQVLTSVPLAASPIGEGVWREGHIPVRRTLHSYWDGRDCLYPSFREANRLTFSLASHQEMRAHYQQADVALFTSMIEHEAFGLVPLEAMASGCPVVATCVGGVG